jgi:hypothetical protein
MESESASLKMAQPKVVVQVYPVLPSDREGDQRAGCPLGRESELYRKIIRVRSKPGLGGGPALSGRRRPGESITDGQPLLMAQRETNP